VKYSFDELRELSSVDGGRFAVDSYAAAVSFCNKFATAHYENFPVASYFLSRKYRWHIVAVYTFARIADDIADENLNISAAERLALLQEYSENYGKKVNTNPVFVALAKTIAEFDIPHMPFDKLLQAFRRDINFTQAETLADLYDYCTYSANPIGELVLRIFGIYTPDIANLSDSVCTALQLTNFWQDFSRDIEKKRIFIPIDLLNKYNLTNGSIYKHTGSLALADCIEELIDMTDNEFNKGDNLPNHIPYFGLRTEIRASILGGRKILDMCRIMKTDLLKFRPKLEKSDIFIIFVKSLLGKK
jgi:squalene synthase HpnC